MFKQFSLNTIYRIIGFIIGFALSIIIARRLGNNDFGVFAIYLTIGGLISGIGMFGFPEYIIRNISISKKIDIKIVFVLLNSLFIILILILFFSFFKNEIYSIFNLNVVSVTNVFYFFCYIVFVSINIHLKSIFEGFHNSQNGYFIKEVLGRLFKLLPLLFIHVSLNNVFLVFFIAEFLVFTLFLVIIVKKFDVDFKRKNREFSINSIKQIYNYTLPLFATTLVLIFNGQTVKLLLGAFEKPKYVGFYDLGLNFAALMIIGLNIQNTILKPHFSQLLYENRFDLVQKYYMKSSKILTLFFLPIGLFFLGMPKIFLMFYGHNFYGASLILQLVIISSIINISTGSNYPILVMSKISHKEFTANIINFFSVIILGPFFIYLFGYVGAGLILILSQVTVNAYRIYVLNKEFGMKPFSNVIGVYSLLFFSMVIVFILNQVFHDSELYLLLFLLVVISITCYIFVNNEFVTGELKQYYLLLKGKIVLK